MAIQILGNTGIVAEVDGSQYRAVRTIAKPADSDALGAYAVTLTSGTIAAALAASAQVWSFRWADATRLAVAGSLRISFEILTPRTAATLTDFGFDLFVGRSYSTSPSGGTAATLTGNNGKLRTSFGSSLATDLRISSTAALTAGTVTLDTNPVFATLGAPQRVNPAAATEEAVRVAHKYTWKTDVGSGECPIVLAQNEGLVLRNRTVWPAAGTGILQVEFRWAEVSSY